jgi:hypothetical protein
VKSGIEHRAWGTEHGGDCRLMIADLGCEMWDWETGNPPEGWESKDNCEFELGLAKLA